MAGVGLTPRRSMTAENIRDLQNGGSARGAALQVGGSALLSFSAKCSSGLTTSLIVLVALSAYRAPCSRAGVTGAATRHNALLLCS